MCMLHLFHFNVTKIKVIYIKTNSVTFFPIRSTMCYLLTIMWLVYIFIVNDKIHSSI